MRKTMEGWIFDAYPEPLGMRLWIVTHAGNYYNFLDPWETSFYLSDGKYSVKEAITLFQKKTYPISSQVVDREELFSG